MASSSWSVQMFMETMRGAAAALAGDANAATIIARASSGQMRAMFAGICAAKNTGDPFTGT